MREPGVVADGRRRPDHTLVELAQPAHLLCGGMQGFVAEPQARAVVRVRDQEKANRERIVARPDQVAQGRESARALGHLLASRVEEVFRVEPHSDERLLVRGLGLRDLVLVVRKQEIHPARVDVQRFAQIALAHRRALDVPAGSPPAEGCLPRCPDLLVLRL